MTEAELYQDIVRRDRIENIAAVQAPTYKEADSAGVGRLAVQRSVIDSETYWGIGLGDPSYNPASPRMEP